MSKLDKVVMAIVEIFEEYAEKDDKKSQLSRAELGELLKNELTHPAFKNKLDPDSLKDIMNELDKNHDGEVNFREFSQYVAGLAKAHYEMKHGKL